MVARRGMPGERNSVAVDGAAQRRMPSDKSRDPVRLTASNREEGVLDLDREESTVLAPVLGGPACRRRAVRRVAGVDLGTRLEEQVTDCLIAEEGSVMQCCRAT